MKNLILSLIISIIIFILYIYFINKNMTYVKSNLDNRFYLVRDVEDKIAAADMLAKIRMSYIKLGTHLFDNRHNMQNKKYMNNIMLLYNQMNNIVLLENTSKSKYTSYSINKGEQIVVCMRKKGVLQDFNLIMYVILHEIAHVACPVYDNHGPLFRELFYWLASAAITIGIYRKIDFNRTPTDYCDIIIDDSII